MGRGRPASVDRRRAGNLAHSARPRSTRFTATQGSAGPRSSARCPAVSSPCRPTGTEVSEGDVVVVVEAMKMEHSLAAPVAGLVEVLVVRRRPGEGDQVLARLVPATKKQEKARISNHDDTFPQGRYPRNTRICAKTVADFARTVVAPVSAKHDEEHSFPVRGRRQDGGDGAVRPAVPGGVRRHGRRLLRAGLALEELGKVDQSVAITLEAGVVAGRDADLPVRQRGAEAAVAAAICWPGGAGRFRAHRAGRRHPTPAAPGPPPASTAAKWVINGTKQFITNSGTDITRWSPSPRSPGTSRTARRRSRRSSCPTAHRDSPSNRPTTRSAGTPRTPTR